VKTERTTLQGEIDKSAGGYLGDLTNQSRLDGPVNQVFQIHIAQEIFKRSAEVIAHKLRRCVW
jgi:hypothetical protein